MRHIYRCPLRWADMDAYGHVNNVVFLRYLEEARIDFLFRPEKDFQQGSVVARHEIDYKRQLVHRHHPVDVELWVTEIRAASFTLTYEVKDDDLVYVRASTVIVPFDFEAQRPRRITEEERAFLKEYMDDSGSQGAVAA
ncbi:acyl-CoA thioesterase [Streptomyces cellulosae]|uniref:Thioesterase family protein n=3 Tax=Streptomyces TaxID=1883 RepID=A0ABU3JEB3_9ACTN|nr:acyl-CoA thioesterase [Streptomyces sp. McG7]MBT2906273.1 acyl-CoA thioesterase [Streptomyces sp. McG8]MCP8710594.1 acyl-CoA thioesterase [Streptomyces sp. AC04842]MCX4477083.1 acyl-CoA thioesterase [Streptomyces cellulosae]MDN3290420.1 thioesterase family protein [Streptomyces thermocarboxydus]MDQ0490938.1 acyl-CoA thioester hydrolase [Streptomyces thermodiastaticus]MDX3413952.1 thioesterase family protein [Streptomyces sp. MD20-1-1]MXQ59040.1 acyl-CoA thioesterase [Streptomyces sp. XHT-